ncbi:hypothetical protein [Nonomuraea sp. NPDC002799]
MTRSLLLVSLAAGSLSIPASAAATEPVIRAITVRPAHPVVGALGSVRLVIDVIAKGASGKDGVTVKVEPGAPPAPLLISKPPVLDAPRPLPAPIGRPQPVPVRPAPAQPAPAQPAPDQPIHAQPQPVQQMPIQHQPARPEPVQQGPAWPELQQGPARPETQQGPARPAPVQQGPAWPEAVQQGPVQEAPAAVAPMRPEPNAAPAPPAAVSAGDARPGAVVPPAVSPRLVWRQMVAPAAGAARMSGGWETWRFLPDKRLNRFYPTGTWTITATARGQGGTTVTEYASFQFRRESRLSSVRAEKSAAGVRLRGSLTRIDPRGLTDYGPFAKQPLEVLWRADPTATWERVALATTDAAGAFMSTVPDRTGGYWRIRYPGTGHYATDVSKSLQST